MAGKEKRRLDWRAPFLCVPSMGTDLEVKVLWEVDRNDPSEPQSDERERVAERSGVARPAGQRTEIGYEAWPTRASGHKTAKLSRSRVRLRRSGARAGTVSVITWGDLALRLKGRRCAWEQRGGARSQHRP